MTTCQAAASGLADHRRRISRTVANGGGLDSRTAGSHNQGAGGSSEMTQTARRPKDEIDDRRVTFLEFIAASSIFVIIALILFMVFTYRPV